MERDVLIAHGASQLLVERLLKSSDATKVWICAKCGHIGWWDANKGKPVCPIHGERGDMHQVELSYAFKLLVQEIMSLGIAVRLRLGDKFSRV
jgi:DNA-directed RNA polymerase subunit B